MWPELSDNEAVMISALRLIAQRETPPELARVVAVGALVACGYPDPVLSPLGSAT